MLENSTKSRVIWVDSLRGLAILFMIVYHIAFDLNYLNILSIEVFKGGWHVFVRITQWMFFLTVGFSLYLSHKNPKGYIRRQWLRALKLFGIAMLLTLISHIFIPADYIRFGALHFISVSILIGALLVRMPLISLVTAVGLYVFSVFTAPYVETSLLIPFGFYPTSFATVDYFPIIPWLGVPLVGITLAHVLDKAKLFKTGETNLLGKVGQKALVIYLIHQPIILAFIHLFIV